MDDVVHPIHGGYYPPGTAPKEHLADYQYYKKMGMKFISPEYFLPDVKEVNTNNYIQARRPDPKSNTGVESLPTGYDKETMGNLLNAYKVAHEKYGVPMLSPQELTSMALIEGRSNLGFNEFDVNNKKAVKLHQELMKQGFDSYAAGFPAAILDKQETAERLKKSFFEVWNGKGDAAKKYNKRIEGALDVADHPKNQELLQYVSNKIGYVPPKTNPVPLPDVQGTELPPIDMQTAQAMPDNYKFGGRVRLI